MKHHKGHPSIPRSAAEVIGGKGTKASRPIISAAERQEITSA
ncbi:hypothetical protein [uncultured Marivita sp.]|nr:hypothetical protein [uncultured Marivita sp.]MCR9111579.1 hypothetical protein [Paracoccaceae bacterium]